MTLALAQLPTDRTPMTLVIAFLDLTRYAAQSRRVDDAALADVIDGYYERVDARVAAAGGRVVKFIGDGALIVFAENDLDAAAAALAALKDEIDAWMAALGWECRLSARAHVGTVIAGAYGGAAGGKRFDVIGAEVNSTALLDLAGLVMSPAAFDRLSPALQPRFTRRAPVQRA
ncbi:MAG TPA: adenylate/guanylate cyclase domain-containing protein [Kofleriaceae bacterium]|nr:adenylate/guanylate cyclase domain-containing protein [Kofleriaceae bacterium]